jgi:predicted RNA binding protein YcfA (HicA-like mRNA interferase family)
MAIVKILEGFGFEVSSSKGSHYKLKRIVNEQQQTLTIPVHGSKPLSTGTVHAIYKQASRYIAEADLKNHFYTD